MSNSVKITYVNESANQDLPKIFLFLKNEIPTFDALRDGVAWRVIEDVGRGSSCEFNYPLETAVRASWNNGTCLTALLDSSIGRRYCVTEDDTGIVIAADGDAGNTRSIDVVNDIRVSGGVSADLYKDGKLMMRKNVVAYGQKATFVLHPKLYVGLASEIQEGSLLSSAVLDSDHFHELNVEGLTELKFALTGNAKDGYQFVIKEHK